MKEVKVGGLSMRAREAIVCNCTQQDWEQNTHIIVMLTQLVERGRVSPLKQWNLSIAGTLAGQLNMS